MCLVRVDGSMETKQVVGVEVPVIGSEILNWIEVSLPSRNSLSHTSVPYSASPLVATPSNDATSGIVFGDPQILVIWRFDSRNPKALEILEIFVSDSLPNAGLRLLFPSPLSPFIFICPDDKVARTGYVLYVLCINGLAYLLKLKNLSAYAIRSVLPADHFAELDLRGYINSEPITSAAAANGSLIIGRNDGIVSCFHLGALEQNIAGFSYEFRDDSGVGRLLGLISRARTTGCVQDLIVLEIHGRKLIFALHVDGVLRVWDLRSRSKVTMHTFHKEGTVFLKLWVGEVDYSASKIPFAVQCRGSSQTNEGVFASSFSFNMNEKISLHLEHSMQIVPLDNSTFMDMKLAGEKHYILTKDCLSINSIHQESQRYELNEDVVAKELFQFPEQSDDLSWVLHSLFSMTNEKIALFISSIFLRKIFQPGVHHYGALHETFLEYNKHWTKPEFVSLTIDELRKEILLLVEKDGFSKTATSIYYYWKKFCARYFFNWRKHNSPHGFLIDTSVGAVVLLRKNSVSLFRSLSKIELLNRGSSEFADVMSFGRDLVLELVQCASMLSTQMLEKRCSVIYYESVVSNISNQEVIPCLLKVLKNGYTPSVTSLLTSDLGVDVARKEQLENHERCRKFSINMLLTLIGLQIEGRTLLDVIQAYLTYLMPVKANEDLTSLIHLTVNTSIFVLATAQTAKAMFEAAFDMLFFLNYLLEISGPVKLKQNDICRIKLELLPKAEEITLNWVIVHLIATSPSGSTSNDDFSSQLSMLQLSVTENQLKWKKRLGRCDFSLAFVLLLDNQKSSVGERAVSLPHPSVINSSVSGFASWIMRNEERCSFIIRACEIAVTLLRNGQADAAELFLALVEKKKSLSSFGCLYNLNNEWCILQHLLGCCFVVKGGERESKLRQAISSFFRASSITGSFKHLQRLSTEAGFPINIDSEQNIGYFQCVMQIFEQRGFSEGAFEFALASLEQVDEDFSGSSESAKMVKGRLWANVFKFSLDMRWFDNAYCAIISNPDEESRCVCLRRFIIVLCERNLVKPLCEREFPFVGMEELVAKELLWKAECSDISSKPNVYKVLYAYEMYRHNWQRAAGFMYRYYRRLKMASEVGERENLCEQINSLSAAINALQFAHSSFTFVCFSKTMRTEFEFDYFGIDDLQKEFVILSAEYSLFLENINWRYTGKQDLPKLINTLIEFRLYDTALTVIFNFFKGSLLNKEMERVFISMALNCCPKDNSLQLIPINTTLNHASLQLMQMNQNHWEILELYLKKYKPMHPTLPVVVAEALLRSSTEIELPRWLIDSFKVKRSDMVGQEPNPSSLLRLYVDYGRFVEATNLILEYVDSVASTRAKNVIKQKRACATWFPYTAIDRLWCQLEEQSASGCMVVQCEDMKKLLHGALLRHLSVLKIDSEDAVSYATC